MAGFDAVFVGSGINALAGAALLSQDGLERRASSSARRCSAAASAPSTDLTAPGLHARGARLVAPALHGLAGLCRAEAGARPARRRVPEHRASHGVHVSGRLSRVPLDLARGQRRGTRAARVRRRRGLGGDVRRLHVQRGSLVRRARDRALVAAGLGLGAPGAAALRAPRPPRSMSAASSSSCRDWLDDDVRVRRRARPARALGPPHGARPGPGDVRLHDAGHRLRPSSSEGCPSRRAEACVLVDALAGIVRDAGGEVRTGMPRSSAFSSPAGGRPRSGSQAARRSARAAPSSPA